MSKYDVVFHIDHEDESINIAFTNAINYAKALINENFQMKLVANAKAVKHFIKNNEQIVPKLTEATGYGLEILICNNALNMHNIDPKDLMPICKVIPAGVIELVELQSKGFAYIKP